MSRKLTTVSARSWFRNAIILAALVVLGYGTYYSVRKSIRWLNRWKESAELESIVATELQSLAHANSAGSASVQDDECSIEETINRMLPDVPFDDVSGRHGTLRDYRGSVLVVSMTSASCPISKKLIPALARISLQYRNEEVRFVAINCELDANRADAKKQADLLAGWRYLLDVDQRLARALAARTTTETFVIDSGQTIRYRGAVDDRFDVGVTRDAAKHEYLHDAITAVLNDSHPGEQLTSSPGCLLGLAARDKSPKPVTWYNQISRLVQYNCVECHRPGEAAPFSLETYAQVTAKKAMIEYVLEERIMPPWFADHSYGKWQNARFVSEADRQVFSEWVSAGCVKGDPSEAPVPVKWASGWTIQQPDVIIDVEPQEVPAEGLEPWRTFPIAFDVPEDIWVAEAEIRPSAPELVHHAMLFVEYADDDPRRLTQESRAVSDSTGGFWLSYFPGRKALVLPAGRGKLIPRHAKISIQLHYNPNGAAAIDRTRIGFKLLPAAPEMAVVTSSVRKEDFLVPPNSRVHFVSSAILDEDIRLLALMPHMHYRGATAQVFVKHPDGRFETLLNVPRYDFNWQISYEFRKPLLVTRGSQIVIRHEFDNTDANPRNPDSTKELRHGDKTTDEMMINFFDWEPADERPPLAVKKNRPFR